MPDSEFCPSIAAPVPRLAFALPAQTPVADGGRSGRREIGRLLARLLADESALYAITRDWRFDVGSRGFVRLHKLLDEQVPELGGRLVQLARRSRMLGCRASTAHGDAVASRRIVARRLTEAQMMGVLLRRHETMLTTLRGGTARVAEHFHDGETTELLADLTANHEKDAFMLRALLWEVQNPA